MRKIYRMNNLDCANCAAKMERAISRIHGVQDVQVNFMAQKLTLECDESNLADILAQAKAAVAKVDPDCTILGA